MLAAAAGAADPDRAASLAPRRADLVDAADDVQGRARVLGEALEGVPAHPSALALLLLEEGVAPAAAGEALWRAGAAAADARRADRAAVSARGRRQRGAGRGRRRRDPARASELVAAMPSDRLAKRALVRVRRARWRPTGGRARSSTAPRRRPRRRRRGRGRGGAGDGAGAGRGGRSGRARRRFVRSRAAASPRMRGARSPISRRGRAAREASRGFRRDCWRAPPTRPRRPRAPR